MERVGGLGSGEEMIRTESDKSYINHSILQTGSITA